MKLRVYDQKYGYYMLENLANVTPNFKIEI